MTKSSHVKKKKKNRVNQSRYIYIYITCKYGFKMKIESINDFITTMIHRQSRIAGRLDLRLILVFKIIVAHRIILEKGTYKMVEEAHPCKKSKEARPQKLNEQVGAGARVEVAQHLVGTTFLEHLQID